MTNPNNNPTAVLELIVAITGRLGKDFMELEEAAISPEYNEVTREAVMTQFLDRIQENVATLNLRVDQLHHMANQIVSERFKK